MPRDQGLTASFKKKGQMKGCYVWLQPPGISVEKKRIWIKNLIIFTQPDRQKKLGVEKGITR